MDDTFSGRGVLQTTQPPGNRSLAHHAWLEADATDDMANYAAYRIARADLSLEVCVQVFALHDSAQHHFITMLLWESGGGSLTTSEAVAEAVKHHHAVNKQ
jgi:hypothetical protein